MPFRFLRGEGSERLEAIESHVQAMLVHGRYEFDLALSALVGDVVAGDVNADLRGTDRKVNQLERSIRRELAVHASVFGGIDTPAVLVYMSIVKDAERVGDYAKNILDLALDGASFGGLADIDDWRRIGMAISRLIGESGEAFRTRDTERCRALQVRSDEMLRMFDRHVSALVRGEDTAPQAVARALAYRYFKRVVAHLMNLVSAVIMPLDRLDFFDEDDDGRTA